MARLTVDKLRAKLRAKALPDFEADRALRIGLLAQLAERGEAALPAVPEVLAQLGHGHHAVREAAIGVLRELDATAASEAIVAFAGTGRKRADGMKAFAVIAGHYDGVAALARGFDIEVETPPLVVALRSALPVLTAAVADTESLDQFARCHAAYALGIFGAGDAAALAALQRAATDEGHRVRDRTAYALRYFGKLGVPTLRVLQRDRGEPGQTATKSLRWIDDHVEQPKRKPKRKPKAKPKAAAKKPRRPTARAARA